MSNLLPQDEQISIRRERNRRFVALILCGASIIFLSGIVVLVPLVVGLYGRERAYTDLLAFTQGVSREQGAQSDGGKDALAQTNEKIALFSEIRNAASVDGILQRLVALAGEDVRIQAFLYSVGKPATPDSREPWTVELRGTARTRDTLTAFERRLEADALVARADIPLEHFAEDSDIDFSVEIIGVSEL